MNAGRKIETLQAIRTEIRALTLDQPGRQELGRTPDKGQRAKRIEHKRRDRIREGFES